MLEEPPAILNISSLRFGTSAGIHPSFSFPCTSSCLFASASDKKAVSFEVGARLGVDVKIGLSVEEGGRLDSLFSTIVGDEGVDREM